MHDIIMAVIGCGVLNIIATAIINALANRKGRLKGIETRLDKVDSHLKEVDGKLTTSEKDALRTQLLLMLSDYPDNTEGIMTLAQRYFGELHGDWYATSIFKHWMEKTTIARPEWFNYKEGE